MYFSIPPRCPLISLHSRRSDQGGSRGTSLRARCAERDKRSRGCRRGCHGCGDCGEIPEYCAPSTVPGCPPSNTVPRARGECMRPYGAATFCSLLSVSPILLRFFIGSHIYKAEPRPRRSLPLLLHVHARTVVPLRAVPSSSSSSSSSSCIIPFVLPLLLLTEKFSRRPRRARVRANVTAGKRSHHRSRNHVLRPDAGRPPGAAC